MTNAGKRSSRRGARGMKYSSFSERDGYREPEQGFLARGFKDKRRDSNVDENSIFGHGFFALDLNFPVPGPENVNGVPERPKNPQNS